MTIDICQCRQSEGSSAEGYTLQEACTLTRSSLIKQRVLALSILSAVLLAARPQASHHSSAGVLMPQPVATPLHSLPSRVGHSNIHLPVVTHGMRALLHYHSAALFSSKGFVVQKCAPSPIVCPFLPSPLITLGLCHVSGIPAKGIQNRTTINMQCGCCPQAWCPAAPSMR